MILKVEKCIDITSPCVISKNMAKTLDMARTVVLLQKPSGAIMIGGALTEYERKLYNGYLKVAHDSLKRNPKEDWFCVPFEELKQVLNLKEQDKHHEYLKNVMKKMNTIQVEYNLLEKDGRVWGVASLLDNIQFKKDDDGHRILVRFTIPKVVTEAILREKIEGFFAKIDLVVIRGLKNKYSVLLYEIVCDYQAVEVPEMTIKDFRKVFGIENKYPKMRDVKRWVLDPACRELNESPAVPFTVSYTLIKQGNRYTHIKFHHQSKPTVIDIKPAEPEQLEASEPETPFSRLLALVPEKHRSKKTIHTAIEKALKSHGEEYCERNIRYANEKANRNYRAFLCRALADDWALAWWEDEQERRARKKLLDSIKNAKIEIDGQVYESDEEGFVYGKNWVKPPGEVLRLVVEGKAKLVETC